MACRSAAAGSCQVQRSGWQMTSLDKHLIGRETHERWEKPMRLPRAPQRTTPGFSFSIVRRSLLDCVSVRQFGRPEMAQVLSFFGSDPPTCVYCGSIDVARWDHLVPVMSGGDTVVGNMVPACRQCDDSKRNLSAAEWASGASAGSPKSRGVPDVEQRLRAISDYVAEHGYRARNPHDRMDLHERARYDDICSRLDGLRADVDSFIASFRENHNQA